jgi:hypothetical protein
VKRSNHRNVSDFDGGGQWCFAKTYLKKKKILQRCVDNQDVKKVFSHCQQHKSRANEVGAKSSTSSSSRPLVWSTAEDQSKIGRGCELQKQNNKKTWFQSKSLFICRYIGIFVFLFLRRKFAIQQNRLDCLFSEFNGKLI